MEYYDPIDHTSKRFAAVVSAVVMALIAVVICFARIDIHPLIVAEPPLEILLEELEEVVEERDMDHSPKPSEDVRNDYRPAHVEEARTEQSQQTSGEAEKTQTVNPNSSPRREIAQRHYPRVTVSPPMATASRTRARVRDIICKVATFSMRVCEDAVCARRCHYLREARRWRVKSLWR